MIVQVFIYSDLKKNVDAIFQQNVSYIIKKKLKAKNALNFI